MCGIAGIIGFNNRLIEPFAIKHMCDIMAHRGPDDAGYLLAYQKPGKMEAKWHELTEQEFLRPLYLEYGNTPTTIEENRVIAKPWNIMLGHRRLAIIDLTYTGHQPMSNRNKTIWVTYNGEIYNFPEIKHELEQKGHTFFSTSDTEVIIHGYEEWGIDVIHKFNGMFAFALWDQPNHLIFLVRDRYGIKPLYYYNKNDIFLFASEIKALLKSGYVAANINPDGLNEYFTFQNILTDKTLFKDIHLLEAGTYLGIEIDKAKIEKKVYWDYSFDSSNFNYSEDDTAKILYNIFLDAVKRHLISDVPIGSYLSGGMDSGSITAVAAKHLKRLSTFTGGFDLSSASGLELSFDEREASEFIANLLKTEHYEVVMHAGDMEHVMPKLIWHLEDLRVGQSYPNYYVARLASKFGKVVLSGAGGDELFGGYPWRYYRTVGSLTKQEYFKRYYEFWQRLLNDEERKKAFLPEIEKHIDISSSFDIFCSVFSKNHLGLKSFEDAINLSLYFEAKTFLHGLFIVEDKLSMAHSLETRVPFMDNELVDFGTTIPPRYKLREIERILKIDENEPGKLKRYYEQTGDGKIILRKAMSKIIPEKITNRVKQGFSAPDASWFRGESIDYIKKLLLDKKARIYNYFNYDFVNNKIQEHISGKRNNRLLIWSFLSFEWWIREFIEGEYKTINSKS
ncbi:MAG: asparagine synthase (glutamine-hydrolyzing) [Deltaproteobacteria bacterium]|nr:asparagine synthase (glutamine-hydrolyzing) [Deltaproteobacteria bacterium]